MRNMLLNGELTWGRMMRIEIKKKAQKFLDTRPEKQRIRLLLAINKLPKGDVVPLSGKNSFRLRVGGLFLLLMTRNS